jgi:hypothetical protein
MEEAWSALADGTMPVEMVVAKAMVTAAENHGQDVGYRMTHRPIREFEPSNSEITIDFAAVGRPVA